MNTCDSCSKPKDLVYLTPQGDRCGNCLVTENVGLRQWLQAFIDLHVRDGNNEGDVARQAYRMLHGKDFVP